MRFDVNAEVVEAFIYARVLRGPAHSKCKVRIGCQPDVADTAINQCMWASRFNPKTCFFRHLNPKIHMATVE